MVLYSEYNNYDYLFLKLVTKRAKKNQKCRNK